MIVLAFDWPCDRKRLMAELDDLVRREEQASHEPSTQVEWLTDKTIAIIAIIIGIIAIISDFFSK